MIEPSNERWFIRSICVGMIVVGALFGAGCTEAIVPTDGLPSTEPDSQSDGVGGDADSSVIPANEEDPSVFIDAPASGETLSSDDLTVVGRASDDSGLATVFVKVGPNSEEIARTRDGFLNWTFDAPTPVGTFTIEAVAHDGDGRVSARETIEVIGRSAAGDTAPPDVLIESPVDGSSPLQTVVVLQGTTTDDVGVVSMSLTLNGDQLEERAFDTSDNYQTWSRRVPLIPGTANVLRVTATDGAGNMSADEVTLFGRSQPDGELPTVQIDAPFEGESVNTGRLTVSGSADDNLAVREVKVRTGAEPSTGCEDRQSVVWTEYVQAVSDDGYGSWSVDTTVNPGRLCVEARAIDVSGIANSAIHTITNTFEPPYTEDLLYFMRIDPFGTPPLVNLSLTKTGVSEIINESIQRDTVVSELDASDLLVNSLDAIKASCGVCWTGAGSTPDERNGGSDSCDGTTDYDCTRTDLGCSFGDEDNNCAGWQDSPEYAMVRLLTLTPDNADLEGTSLGELQNLLGNVTRSYISDIFAQALEIGPNDSVVSTEGVALALRDDLIATHPNAVFNPSAPDVPLLRLTLYDVVQDLAPLSETYGPVGEHPGILDPANPPFGEVFPADTFRMILVGESNLRFHDGIRLAQGKDYIGLVDDTNGPTFDDVVEFDFQDDERFAIIGLPPEPSIDLQFAIFETDRDIPVCAGDSNETQGDDNCIQNRKGSPYQSQYVWSLDPWNLEYILADAAVQTGYSSRNHYVSEPLGVSFLLNTEVFVGNAGGRRSAPPGWAEFAVSGLGSFIVPPLPPQQFFSETIMDIGEVVGHRNVGGPGGCPAPNSDYRICEGDLNVVFALKDVPTGVTAEKLENDSREFLQAQRKELGDRLLGDFEQNNGCVDFYYDELNGRPALVYAIASDPRPATDCPAPPTDGAGFFADEDLTEKISSMTISGIDDTEHEKLMVEAGMRTVYLLGADGETYRLKLDVPNLDESTEITVAVARRLR